MWWLCNWGYVWVAMDVGFISHKLAEAGEYLGISGSDIILSMIRGLSVHMNSMSTLELNYM